MAKEIKKDSTLPEQAVYMPLEVLPGNLCVKSRVYKTNNYYDVNGVPLDMSDWKEGDPLPSFTERVDFYPGDLVYLPLWSAALVDSELKTGEYAKAEAQEEIKAKMQEFAKITDTTTGHPATYKKLMSGYRDDLISRGLMLLPEGGLAEAKKEGG